MHNDRLTLANNSLLSVESFSPSSPALTHLTPVENIRPIDASTPCNVALPINFEIDPIIDFHENEEPGENNDLSELTTVFQPVLFNGSDVKLEHNWVTFITIV